MEDRFRRRFDRPPRRLTWPLIAALVVILAAAGIANYLLRQPSTTSQPSTTLQPSTISQPFTTSEPVSPVAQEGMLLSPDQIDTATGATGMTVSATYTVMSDASAQLSDKACLPLAGVAQHPRSWPAAGGAPCAARRSTSPAFFYSFRLSGCGVVFLRA